MPTTSIDFVADEATESQAQSEQIDFQPDSAVDFQPDVGPSGYQSFSYPSAPTPVQPSVEETPEQAKFRLMSERKARMQASGEWDKLDPVARYMIEPVDPNESRLSKYAGAVGTIAKNLPRLVGKGLGLEGKALQAGAGRLFGTGDTMEDVGQAVATGKPMPVEESAATIPGFGGAVARGGLGILETIPKLGLLAAFPGSIYAQTVAAGGIFGLDAQGNFSVKSAAIGALLPGAGQLAKGGVARALTKGIASGATALENRTAQWVLEEIGMQAALNAVMIAGDAPELIALYREDPIKARNQIQEMVGQNFAWALFGGARHFLGKSPTATEAFVRKNTAKAADYADKLLTRQIVGGEGQKVIQEALGDMQKRAKERNIAKLMRGVGTKESPDVAPFIPKTTAEEGVTPDASIKPATAQVGVRSEGTEVGQEAPLRQQGETAEARPTVEPEVTPVTAAVEPQAVAVKPAVVLNPGSSLPDYDPQDVGMRVRLNRKKAEGLTHDQAVEAIKKEGDEVAAVVDSLPVGSQVRNKDGILYENVGTADKADWVEPENWNSVTISLNLRGGKIERVGKESLSKPLAETAPETEVKTTKGPAGVLPTAPTDATVVSPRPEPAPTLPGGNVPPVEERKAFTGIVEPPVDVASASPGLSAESGVSPDRSAAISETRARIQTIKNALKFARDKLKDMQAKVKFHQTASGNPRSLISFKGQVTSTKAEILRLKGELSQAEVELSQVQTRRPKKLGLGITSEDGMLKDIVDNTKLPIFIASKQGIMTGYLTVKRAIKEQGYATSEQKEFLSQFPRNYEDNFGPDGSIAREAYDAAVAAGIDGELFTVVSKNGNTIDVSKTLTALPEKYRDLPMVEIFRRVKALAEEHLARKAGTGVEDAEAKFDVESKEALKRDLKEPSKGTQPIPLDQIQEGTVFKLDGTKVTVTGVRVDEEFNIVEVELKDGSKYGTHWIEVGEGTGYYALRADTGTAKNLAKPGDAEFVTPAEEAAATPKPTPATTAAPVAPPPPVPVETSAKGAPAGTKIGSAVKGEDGKWRYINPDTGKTSPPIARSRADQLEAQWAKGPAPADTRSPIEVLNSSKQVTITAPEGATKIRVTDAKGRRSEIWLKDFSKFNPAYQVGTVKLEAGNVGRDGKFNPIAGEVKVVEKSLPLLSESVESEILNSGNTVSGAPPVLSPQQAAKQARYREIFKNSRTAFEALQQIVSEGMFTGQRKEIASQLLQLGELGVKLGLGGKFYSNQWRSQAAGQYFEKTDTAHVYDTAFEYNKAGATFLHEYIHALTKKAIDSGKYRSELESLFNAAYLKASREGLTFHGLSEVALAHAQGRTGSWSVYGGYEIRQTDSRYVPHLQEFVAEALSNKKFQDFLARTRSPLEKGVLRTLFDDFVAWLAKSFGIKQTSALHDAIRIGLDLATERAKQDAAKPATELQPTSALEWLAPGEPTGPELPFKPTVEDLNQARREERNRQIYGVKFGEKYTPVEIEVAVQNVRNNPMGFDGKGAITPANIQRALGIVDQMTNPETRSKFANDFAAATNQSGAASLLRNELWEFGFRMLMQSGDGRVFESMRQRVGDIETSDSGLSGSAVGLSAAGLEMRFAQEMNFNSLWKPVLDYTIQERQAAGGRLGVGQEAFGNLLQAINQIAAKMDAAEWDAIIRTGKDSKGRTISDILAMDGPERIAATEIVAEIPPEAINALPRAQRLTILETVYEWMSRDVMRTEVDQREFVSSLVYRLATEFNLSAKLSLKIAESTWRRKTEILGSKTERMLDAELRALDAQAENTAMAFIRQEAQAEWVKLPTNNPIKNIITEALRDRSQPIDENNALGGRTRLEERLIAARLSPETARTLSQLIWQRRATDFYNANSRAQARAAQSKSLRSLIESIKTSPYLAQNDPAWRKETARLWFVSNGLSNDSAKAAANRFETEFVNAFAAAAEKIAMNLMRQAEPRTIKELTDAIRSGLLDPSKAWVGELASRNKFVPLTTEDFAKVAKLEQKLADPNINPYEQVALVEQMLGVMRHAGDQTGHFSKALGESFAASLLSGIRTSTLQVGQPGMHQVLTWAVHSVFEPRDFVSLTKAAWNATKNFIPEFSNAWVKDATSFEAHSAGLWKNELKRQFEVAEREWKNGKYHKAIPRFAYAWQQYVVRTLRSFDQATMAVMREYNLALYGSMAMRMAGFKTQDVRDIVEITSRYKLAALDQYLADGRSKMEARAMADYDAAIGVRRWFQGKLAGDLKRANMISESALSDAFNVTGRKAPGIDEFSEGFLSMPANWLMKKVSEARREGGIPSIMTIMAVGFCNVPLRTARYYAGWSPYGLMRWGIHSYMQSNIPGSAWLKQAGRPKGEPRETFWKQTYANELSAKARLREALAGTGLMLAFLAWQHSHSTADDDAEKRPFAMFATGSGPTNKTMRDAWLKRGYQPFSLHVILNGKVVAAIPTTRAGQILAYPMGIAAALDDVQWKRKQNAAMGRPIKNPVGQEILTGISTYYNIVGAQGIFQAAGHIAQLQQGGGGIGRAIGMTAASTASALAIPGKSLLQGVTDMVYGPVDRSSVAAAMVANVPVVSAFVNGQAVNRFGDVIGDRSWYAMLSRLGAPIAIRVADTPDNRAMYQMILDKGTAPPDLRRSIIEEKYGPLTQAEWQKFTQVSGASLKKSVLDNIKLLSAPEATPAAVHQFMVKAGADANDQAAAALKLEVVPRTSATGAIASSGGGGGGGNMLSLPKGPKLSPMALSPASVGSGGGSMAGVPQSSLARGSSAGTSARSSVGLGAGRGLGSGTSRMGTGRIGRLGGMSRRSMSSVRSKRAPRFVSGRLGRRSGRSTRRIRVSGSRSRTNRVRRLRRVI